MISIDCDPPFKESNKNTHQYFNIKRILLTSVIVIESVRRF